MLGVTDYLICGYERAGTREVVGVYVGYHQTQVRKEGGGLSRERDPPPNALPSRLGLGHHRPRPA